MVGRFRSALRKVSEVYQHVSTWNVSLSQIDRTLLQYLDLITLLSVKGTLIPTNTYVRFPLIHILSKITHLCTQTRKTKHTNMKCTRIAVCKDQGLFSSRAVQKCVGKLLERKFVGIVVDTMWDWTIQPVQTLLCTHDVYFCLIGNAVCLCSPLQLPYYHGLGPPQNKSLQM